MEYRWIVDWPLGSLQRREHLATAGEPQGQTAVVPDKQGLKMAHIQCTVILKRCYL